MQIESGNLSQAARLLEGAEDTPYRRALEANLSARSGDFDGAIALYESLIYEWDGKERYRLLWNYLQTLRERGEFLDWQSEQEQDPSVRNSLQSLSESDRSLALSLARHHREDLEIAVALWQLSPTEVSIEPIKIQVLALEDSGLKVELLLAIGEVQEALKVAQTLNEPRFLSWTYGELGRRRLQQGRVEEAIASCHLARVAANRARDFLDLARWQGCLAEAYVSSGEKGRAKRSYEVAVDAVGRVRDSLVGYRVNPLTLKEIRPILRGYLGLLLESPDGEDLKKAVGVQKLSTLSELDSYFKSLCDLEVGESPPVSTDAAYIYTVILESRSYFIVQTESGYSARSIDISRAELERQLYRWRLALADPSQDAYIEGGRRLYELLLQPLEPLLAGKRRLIFVQDGLLRTVPMAALIDGDEFLLERYEISYSLGFKLQEPGQRLRTALVAGASRTSTELLPSVEREISLIGEILQADVLAGEQLSLRTLANKIQGRSYGIVHIATRNQITPDINGSRFSLGGQDVSLLEFERLLRDRRGDILFLNLAACDTATGNSVAVLGLTGIGLRTGIRSTVGSLWGIPDETTTAFMLRFYQSLLKTGDYSGSLRQVQLEAIRNPSSRPYSWAGFISLTNE